MLAPQEFFFLAIDAIFAFINVNPESSSDTPDKRKDSQLDPLKKETL